MNVLFVIDEVLNERQYECGFPTLAEAAKEQGHEVITMKHVPFTDKLSMDLDFRRADKPVVVHGCIQFIRNFNNTFNGVCPGPYQNENVRSFHKFAVPLNDYLLNNDYFIVPFHTIRTRPVPEPIFVKPLSGLKQFTGKVITQDNFNDTIQTITQYEKIDDDFLCVVSSVKNIKAEFRYVIADRKVITGSEYRWDNVLDVRIDTLPECDILAEKIASLEWQADYVYVCDIAMTDEGPKVIELNSFSSSGLYACDTRKIVKAVSDIAIKEFNGDV